jgi:MoxR-like ATPase
VALAQERRKKEKEAEEVVEAPPVVHPPPPPPQQQADERRSLYDFLRSKGYLTDRTTAELLQNALEMPGVKAFLLEGPPGVGKTSLTELIAQWLGADGYIYVLSTPNTDEDTLLYKFVPDENTKSGIRVAEGPVTQAVKRAAKGEKVVLVIDEFDKTRPSADALLLDLLQNGRITLYLGGKEDVVKADPNNLYIFLTSNNMRELSEPLARRLARVEFGPLPTSEVLELMRAKFEEPIALLLAQVYDDTVQAGLRKPATIQELIQLGNALRKTPNVPLDRLLRMYVVKYDDDWEKLKEYVKKRKPYSFAAKKGQEGVAENYKPPPGLAPQEAAEKQEGTAAGDLLNMLGQALVRRPEAKEPEAQAVPEAKPSGFTFKAPLTDDVYTAIAKTVAEPGETGGVIGKFKVADVGGERALVAEEPLTIGEFLELYKQTRTPVEGYIEDQVYMVVPDDLRKLLENAKSVKYYSRNAIMIRDGSDDAEEDVLIELPEPFTRSGPRKYLPVKVKAYVKAKGLDENTLMRGSLPTLEKVLELGSCSKAISGGAGFVPLVADMVKTCLARGARDVSIEVDRANASKQDVEELNKTLGEMLSPLGVNVRTYSSCADRQRIGGLVVRLSGSENEAYINCIH